MKLADFATLDEAKAYCENVGRMVSADQMRIFFLTYGLYLYFKNHSEPLEQATYDNMLSAGQYNFIDGHASNVSGLVDMLIANASNVDTVRLPNGSNLTVKAAITALKQACVDFANVKTYPFENTTQAEFDAAKFIPVRKAIDVYIPNANHLTLLSGEGADITLTDISVDGDFELLLDTCSDSADQSKDESFVPFNGGAVIARVTSHNNKAQFNISSRKVRTYNRFYIRALHECTFKSEARLNRG